MTPSSNAELVVVAPTLGRPHALEPLAQAFAATTESYRILFVIDEQDRPTRRAIKRMGRPDVDYISPGGSYAQKVNAGIRASTEPLILVGADDIRPHPGWLEAAKAYMSETVGFVSPNDLGNDMVMRGLYATLPLVARWYAESEGDLYHEGYQHAACDVDASLQAQARGAYAYAPNAIVEHLHPDHGKSQPDETYRQGGLNRHKRRADRLLLNQRWPGRWQQIAEG